MGKFKKFLIGAERAEYEHVYGPLPTDQHDPRFVLVDDETSAQIDQFNAEKPPIAPSGVIHNQWLGARIADASKEGEGEDEVAPGADESSVPEVEAVDKPEAKKSSSKKKKSDK